MEKEFLSEEDDVETSEGKSIEERLKMYKETFKNTYVFDSDSEEDDRGRHSITFEEYAAYRLDRIETEGFDLGEAGDYSKAYCTGMMVRYYDPQNIPAREEDLIELQDLSGLAIKEYNAREGTNYDHRNVHVLKANVEPCGGVKFYITFQASDDGITKTFQARVYVGIPTTLIKTELVRTKIPRKPLLITRRRRRSVHSLNPVSTPTV